MIWISGGLNVPRNSPYLAEASGVHAMYVFQMFKTIITEITQLGPLENFKTTSQFTLVDPREMLFDTLVELPTSQKASKRHSPKC